MEESSGTQNALVSDLHGNVVARVPSGGLVWQGVELTAYGAVPNSTLGSLSSASDLASVTAWRGMRQDASGLMWMGMRHYDPSSGRFLSTDPLGHETSLSLYDYADGDPINSLDPDGRFGKGVSSGWNGSVSASSPNSAAFNLGMSLGGSTSGYYSGMGRGAVNIGVGVKDGVVGIGQTAWAFTGGAINNAYNGQQTIYGALASVGYSLATSSSAQSAAWNGVTSYVGETFTDTDLFSQRVGGGAVLNLATLGVSQYAQGLRAAAALSTTARSASLGARLEANAGRILANMEGDNPEAHFLSRHGVDTGIEAQYVRSTTGLTPDGIVGHQVNSSMFTSNLAQLRAAQRAQTLFAQTGQNVVEFSMDEIIGQGFTKGGKNLVNTSNVRAVFKNGKLYTMFPKLTPNL